MLRLTFLNILGFGLLASCANDRALVLNADNPASPIAREAITSPAQSVLNLDQASKRTRELIAARAAQDRVIQAVAKIGYQAVSRVVNQIRTCIVENTLEHRGDDESVGYDCPHVMEVGRNQRLQVHNSIAVGNLAGGVQRRASAAALAANHSAGMGPAARVGSGIELARAPSCGSSLVAMRTGVQFRPR